METTQENATQNALDVPQDSSPVTEVQDAVNEESAPSAVPEEQTPELNDEEGSSPSGAQKRIQQLAAQKRAEREARIKAEAEAAYWRGVNEGRGKPETQQQAPVTPSGPPTLDQFETFEEYERAKDEYVIQQAEQRIARRFEEHQKQEKERATAANFQKRIDDAIAADPALYEIVTDRTLPVSDGMVQVLHNSDMAPQILKWLHNNRSEAAKIAALPPILAARELGRVEVMIQNKPQPQPPKRVSAAPEPIKTVTPAGSTIVDDDDLPLEEYVKRKNAAQFGRK